MLTKKSFQQDTSVIFALCVAYFVIQSLFIPFATLSVDDFWLAYHVPPGLDFSKPNKQGGYKGLWQPDFQNELLWLTVNPAVLTITANSDSKTYGVSPSPSAKYAPWFRRGSAV